MEELERPNKIRKTSHERDASVSLPHDDNPASTATSEPHQQQTESTATLVQNGVTELPQQSESTEAEADALLKAWHSVPLPEPPVSEAAEAPQAPPASQAPSAQQAPQAQQAPDTDTPTTAPDGDKAGPASETPATPSIPDDSTNPPPPTTTTNGTGWTGVDTTTGLPLSKNQQKKARREARWAQKKAERKAGRKEERREKRSKKRAERGPIDHETWKSAQLSYVPPTNLPITLVIDCDFDDKMKDNERISLGGQITRSYSENKNAKWRTHLCVSSFQGKLRERFDGVLTQNYRNWKATHFVDEDFTVAVELAKEWMGGEKGGELKGVFAKYGESEESAAKAKEEGEIIYLSSDSDVTLTELKPYSTYIIGGLVDKNREKGICHRRAVEKGFKTARLPIGDYLDMASRKVLATNHVVEIMLRWLELGDWGEAFMKVIPMRKGAKLKEAGEKGDGDVKEGEKGEGEGYVEEEEFDEDEDEEGVELGEPSDEAVSHGEDGKKTAEDEQMDLGEDATKAGEDEEMDLGEHVKTGESASS